jgi:hypothetical protein
MNPDGVVFIAYRVRLVVTTDRDESPSSEMRGSTANTLIGSTQDLSASPLREPIQELRHRKEPYLREVLLYTVQNPARGTLVEPPRNTVGRAGFLVQLPNVPSPVAKTRPSYPNRLRHMASRILVARSV